MGVKRPEREADHSHPSSAEVKKLHLHSPNTRGAQLKHRENFTFTLIYPVLTHSSKRLRMT
jgi:hypothetical protein